MPWGQNLPMSRLKLQLECRLAVSTANAEGTVTPRPCRLCARVRPGAGWHSTRLWLPARRPLMAKFHTAEIAPSFSAVRGGLTHWRDVCNGRGPTGVFPPEGAVLCVSQLCSNTIPGQQDALCQGKEV